MKLRVKIPGVPVAQGRPRAVRIGDRIGMYDPPKSRDYKNVVRDHLIKASRKMKHPVFPSGPVAVSISMFFPCPKSDYRKTVPVPLRWRDKRPEIDNVAKGVLDAAIGIAYTDDAQVAALEVRKLTAAQEGWIGVAIEVSSIAPLATGE